MAYIIPTDYLKIIQDANLQQIITANDSIRISAELAAQAEAISYLRQKYDVKGEFTDTTIYSPSLAYKAKNRVYLNAVTYNPSVNYSVNNLTLYNGLVYICNASTTGTFDPTKWNGLGSQYEIFYAVTPYPEFDLTLLYNKGDYVFWQNKVYKCLVATPILDHEDGIQYYQQNEIPYANVFPNDKVNGSTHWQYISDYSFSGINTTNVNYWQAFDNRDQQMVMYFTDITLYHLHARIAPRNIPELRILRYQSAIEWLKMASKGEITPALPVLQPAQGGRIRYGGQVRNINSY